VSIRIVAAKAVQAHHVARRMGASPNDVTFVRDVCQLYGLPQDSIVFFTETASQNPLYPDIRQVCDFSRYTVVHV
jgi:hypothetical protein